MSKLMMISIASATVLFATHSAVRSEPMRFFEAASGGRCGECEWVAADGDITPDTPDAFREFWKTTKVYYPQLHINSQGGDLSAGVELGQLFRESHLYIKVGKTVERPDSTFHDLYDEEEGVCVSACAYAFLGGELRKAGDNEIGIHQFSASLSNSGRPMTAVERDNGIEVRTILSDAQKAGAYLINYVNAMGVDARFVALASSTESVRYLTDDELDLYKVRWRPNEFAPWGIRPLNTGIVASSKTYDGKIEALVYCFGDRRPHFDITALEPQPDIEKALAKTEFIIFGQTVRGAINRPPPNKGPPMLQFSLREKIDPSKIIDSGQIFNWQYLQDAMSGYFSYRSLSIVGAKENITAALTHCAT